VRVSQRVVLLVVTAPVVLDGRGVVDEEGLLLHGGRAHARAGLGGSRGLGWRRRARSLASRAVVVGHYGKVPSVHGSEPVEVCTALPLRTILRYERPRTTVAVVPLHRGRAIRVRALSLYWPPSVAVAGGCRVNCGSVRARVDPRAERAPAELRAKERASAAGPRVNAAARNRRRA
jgi:hypothetical protein